MSIWTSLFIGIALALLIPRVLGTVKSLSMRGKKAPALKPGEVFPAGRRLIYFFTDSCPGCRMQSPIMEQIAKKYPGTVSFVNAAENMESTREYGVFGVPFTVFLNNGTIAKTGSGLQSEKILETYLATDAQG